VGGRSQLNAVGATTGKRYLLTAAVPTAPEDISLIQGSSVANSLDWADVMAYDTLPNFKASSMQLTW
jgi:chitinase